MTNYDMRLIEAAKLPTLVSQSELERTLVREIAMNCRRKVTKRLALQLAQPVLQADNDGSFFADKVSHRLLVWLRNEVLLRELKIDRPVRRR